MVSRLAIVLLILCEPEPNCRLHVCSPAADMKCRPPPCRATARSPVWCSQVRCVDFAHRRRACPAVRSTCMLCVGCEVADLLLSIGLTPVAYVLSPTVVLQYQMLTTNVNRRKHTRCDELSRLLCRAGRGPRLHAAILSLLEVIKRPADFTEHKGRSAWTHLRSALSPRRLQGVADALPRAALTPSTG